MKPRLGSLFSGYGGLDLAIEEVFDAETVWVSDIDSGACKILAHRFPDAPNLGDITTVDWTQVAPVDIIAGGSPCQDISNAGKRAGMREGTRSNLWVEMREAIATLRPALVIWENVNAAATTGADSDLEPCAGCVGDAGPAPSLRALGRVHGDLASLGYNTQWISLQASDVGACHGRRRVFVLAADPHGQGLPERWYSRCVRPQISPSRTATTGGCDESGARFNFGPYAAAVERQEIATGRRAPNPTSLNSKGNEYLSSRFCEWMMGLPDGWVCDVPGITRAEAIKACGNGVYAPQAAHALRVMAARFEIQAAA